LAVLCIAGCGGGHSGKSAGAAVFATAGCAGCHTLAAAHTHGQIGPDLDQLQPDYATVARQVRTGGNGMPSFAHRLTSKSIDAVAKYVSTVASATAVNQTALQFKPNKTTVASCHSTDFNCLRQAYGNVAYYHGPATALSELQADSHKSRFLSTFCHQIAHGIGHAAYTLYKGNAAKALGNGGMECGSGYYHGVVERAFSGLPRARVAAAAKRLCSTLPAGTTAFILYQCVHGLGHGLMIYSADDLPFSLRVCDSLQTQFDQISCTGGVFMQNFAVGVSAMVQTRYVKANDLLYPCDAVAPRDKLYCYLQATERILPAVGYDWAKAAVWCRRAGAQWVRICFQSYGRDASGFTDESTPGLLRICRIAGSMQRECLYGAVRDIANNAPDGRQAAGFCKRVPSSDRAYCFEGVGTILGAAGTARQTCRRVVPSAYRRDCYSGAGLT
jgi:cytochrome c553